MIAGTEEKNTSFESLTPVSNIEDLGIYESALDFVFAHDEIRNVALSGSYGAGKSSVLESYKKKKELEQKQGERQAKDQKANKERPPKYIHISLAHFEEETTSTNSNTSKEINESVLEGKILNQLIHQIPESSIPQTNFRIKTSISNKILIENVLCFTGIVLLALYLFFSSTWERFVASFPDTWFKKAISLMTSPYAFLLGGIILAVLMTVAFVQIVRLQKNHRILKKLNLQGYEIELFQDSNESFFDKYLNEVLYLFENADADVIVFEDMDRFNANQIFERLREVNTLINQKSKNRIIRFFYLLKDDIFASKDRTKFFDFIIPIVPVVDGSNSYDQFVERLQKNGLLDKFDDRFLRGLALYVDEMRLLKNICNELFIYYDRINTTELDYNKMLAIITYKNLFPRDFSELQLGRGYVHSLFEKKDELIQAEQEKIEHDLKKLEDEFKTIESEILESVDELSAVYNNKRSRNLGNGAIISKLNDEEATRRKTIQDKKDGRKDVLQAEIASKKQTLERLQVQPLREIINRENEGILFQIQRQELGDTHTAQPYAEVKSNPYYMLLKFLIREGYIDESYSDYMTYFYENSLSRTDKMFLRSITDRKAKPYGYELKDCKRILEQLNEFDFDQEEALNCALTDYLMNTCPDSKYVKHLVHQIASNRKYEFLIGYMNISNYSVDFVHQCNLNRNDMFTILQNDSAFPRDMLIQYVVYTLYTPDRKAITEINIENCLTKYISSSTSILSVEVSQVEQLVHGFKLLGVRFENLCYDSSNKALFDAVFNNSLYIISYHNLREILRGKFEIIDDDFILHSNYSAIRLNPNSPLSHYVSENMESYVDAFLFFCDGEITDENEAATEILNSTSVTEEQKMRYIECLSAPLLSLSLVSDKGLWSALIGENSVVFTENNAIDYFLYSKKTDTSLIKLINSATEVIDFRKVSDSYEVDEIDTFFESVVVCDEIDDERYEQCVVSLNHYYNQFNLIGLSNEKIMILINHDIIGMSLESLKHLRAYYQETVVNLIEKHIDEYIELIDAQTFSFDEMLQVLLMDVSEGIKLRLMEFTSKPISILNKDYSTPICSYILENNPDPSEMPMLFKEYETFPNEIQKSILRYAVNNPNGLIDCADDCSIKLVENYFDCNEVSIDVKIQLLVMVLPRIERVEAQKFFYALGLTEFADVFNPYARPKYEITSRNVDILNAIRENRWINEYYEDPEHPGYYRIRRKSHKKTPALAT